MAKLVRKSIRRVQYQDTSAVLKPKDFGMNAVWIQVAVGVVSLIIGLLFGISTQDPLIFVIFIVLGFFLIINSFSKSINEYFEFNKANQVFKYFSGSSWTKKEQGKIRVKTFAFNKLTIDWESARQFDSVTILIQAEDRYHFILTLPKTSHAKLLKWLEEKPKAQAEASIVETGIETEEPADNLGEQAVNLMEQRNAMAYTTMLKEIVTWGRSSLFLGLVHLVASGFLNPGWGVTLLAVGGLSFLVQEASMFVLYAIALIWVGLSNIMSLGLGLWTLFGAYQIYLGVMLFKKYRRYRDFEWQHLSTLEHIPEKIKVGRAAKWFPWVGGLLSGAGLAVYVAVWLFLFIPFVVTVDQAQPAPLSDSLLNTMDLILGVALGFGIVGFGLSLAALISNYKPRWAGWAGVVFGSLLALVEILIRIWLIVNV